MKRIYEQIEGNLTLYYDGRVFVGEREVQHENEMLHIPVKELKKIIKDVVADTKEGLWK